MILIRSLMKRFLRPGLLTALSLATLASLPPGFAQTPPATAAAPSSATPAAAPAAPAVDPFWPADGKFPVPGRTSGWTGFRPKNVQRRTLFAQRKEQDRGAVVFVGDSITEGWRTLEADFADLGVKVANRGIGGDTTPNLVWRLKEDVLSLQPRAIVLLIGTNDLGENTSPEQIAANIAEIHRRIRAAAPKIPLALCLVMPRAANNTYPERIRALNALIKQFAARDGGTTLCDTFTPLAQEDGSSKPEAYNADRLHLNPTGYGIWRDTVKPIVASWKLGAR